MIRLLSLVLVAVFCAGAAEAGEPPGKVEAAIEKGLAWLRGQADDQGRYSMTMSGHKVPNPGYTALALTPILKALPKDKRASDALVKKATAYLIAFQRKDGAIASDDFKGYENYLTAATVMALAALDDPKNADAMKRMADFLLTLQRTGAGRHEGGFGYNKSGGADLSNAQFTIEALRTAGIPEDHPAMVRARAYLSRVQNRSENAENAGKTYEIEDEKHGKIKVGPGNDGSAGYEPGVSKAGFFKLPDGTYVPRGYGSMTYALLKSYILSGLKGDDPRVKAAVGWLEKNVDWDQNPGFQDLVKEQPHRKDAPYFGLFYYYMTAAKALAVADKSGAELGGKLADWRKDLAAALVARQRADGSWVNEKSPRWDEGNPALCTAYALIALQETLDR